VSKYLITITSDDRAAADAAHTTVRVDTSTGQTRITELTVRAADGGGLAPADLPPVDLDLLVRALTAPAPAMALPPAAEATPAEASIEEPASEPVARPGRAASGSRRGRGGKVAAKASRRRARRAGGGQTRPYRRMPEPTEVLAAYEQIGSITGLAEHFGVPRHTVTSWARRLRQQGYAIGRGA
jgi:hypothetical protein